MRQTATLFILTAAAFGCGASITPKGLQSSDANDGMAPNGAAQTGDVQDSNISSSTLVCPSDAGDTYAAVRIACVQAINAYRKTLDLAPFSRWCGNAGCVDQQTQEDSQQQTAHAAFGKCNERAQNECPGWSLPVQGGLIKCLGQMWEEGPGNDYAQHGHYINMTSQSYSQVECGVLVFGTTFWGAVDFR